MLHAAAMLAGLFALALLMTQGWTSVTHAAAAFVIALATTAFALRFGGGARTPFSAAPQMLVLIASHAQRIARGAFAVVRAAAAADVTLKPALVRVRSAGADSFSRAAAVSLISAAPGSIVVEADAEGMLVHVIDEDAAESEAFTAIEAGAAALLSKRGAL
jgi:multisubunit Na+/H+ antiporter MnhE subunit